MEAVLKANIQNHNEPLPVRQEVSAAPSVRRRRALQLLVLRGKVLQLLVLGEVGGEDGGDGEQDGAPLGATQLVDHDGGQNHPDDLRRHKNTVRRQKTFRGFLLEEFTMERSDVAPFKIKAKDVTSFSSASLKLRGATIRSVGPTSGGLEKLLLLVLDLIKARLDL